MATQMQLEVILAGNRIATRVTIACGEQTHFPALVSPPGGREATTGNMSAVRRLASQLKSK